MFFKYIKKYSFLFVSFILLIYFILGFSIPRIVGHEVFPFFRWDLFTFIPAQQQELERIIIKSINGEELNPPMFFSEIREKIVKEGRPIERDYTYMKELANYIEGKRIKEIKEMRKIFEDNFSASSIQYDLVKIRVDSYELWELVFKKNKGLGAVDNWDYKVVASFTFNRD